MPGFYSLRGMARLSDGSVAVIDRRDQRVRIFSETGEFLRSMGGRGEGPGEFRNPWFLWALPGDTLWVGDYRPQRFNVCSPDGDFLRLVTPDPHYFESGPWRRCVVERRLDQPEGRRRGSG